MNATTKQTTPKPLNSPAQDALEILAGATLTIESLIGIIAVAHADQELSDERHERFIGLATRLALDLEGVKASIGQVSR